jgi:hypothetical protein
MRTEDSDNIFSNEIRQAIYYSPTNPSSSHKHHLLLLLLLLPALLTTPT